MLGWCPCSEPTPSPARSGPLCFQSPGDDGWSSRTAWAAHGVLHTLEKTAAGPDSTLPRKPRLGYHALPGDVRRHGQLAYSRLLPGSAGFRGRGASANGLSAGLGMEVTGRGMWSRMARCDFGYCECTATQPPPSTCTLPTKHVPKGLFQPSKPIGRFTKLFEKKKPKTTSRRNIFLFSSSNSNISPPSIHTGRRPMAGLFSLTPEEGTDL